MGLGADDDRAAPFKIGFARAGPAQNGGPGREIGGRDDFHQLFHADVGVVDHGQGAVDHFTQIVRRDAGGHADGNALGAVDQHVREPGRQNCGFAVFAVVVVLKLNGFFIDVGHQKRGGLVHPHFGIAHGRRRIAVH